MGHKRACISPITGEKREGEGGRGSAFFKKNTAIKANFSVPVRRDPLYIPLGPRPLNQRKGGAF